VATFERAGGSAIELKLQPRPALMFSRFKIGADLATADHLLGLTPVLRVSDVEPQSGGAKAGFQPGDVFSLLGAREWPSSVDGIEQIRAHKGRDIRVSVMRKDAGGAWGEVDLGKVPVDRKGQIGFRAGDSAEAGAWVAGWPRAAQDDPKKPMLSGASLPLVPGSRILRAGGEAVESLFALRETLRRLTKDAGENGATVELAVALPGVGTESPRIETVQWMIPADELRELRSLVWLSPIPEDLFESEMTVLKASGPVEAIGMGLRETHSVMLQTYLTFARLFQGTVKVTHLKGPVGIAHVGTLLAGRGWVWLVFFMALISVNLAVINFLPIPIADGGHMVFLIYEQTTGKPVSPMVQNISALVGLVMLASLFLVVTFNDLRNLFLG
jgi:regulator of sigma E protease